MSLRLKKKTNIRAGFTIVELLIVIVVIGILAAITIVAFNGVQNKAKTSVVQNDIAQSIRKLESLKVTDASEKYPATQADAGLSVSGGVTLNYYYDSASNRYCIEAVSGTIAYSQLGLNESIKSGRCSDNGLVGWWAMNNATADQSGNAYNGTATDLIGGDGQNGITNSGYIFNGGTSNFTVPDNSNLHPSAMTISIWIKPTAWASTAATNLVSKRAGSTGYFFHYLTASRTVNLDVAGSGNRWNTSYTPPLGQWTHMVITVNSAGRNFYVNGVLNNTNTTLANTIVTNTTDLTIGRDISGYTFNGTIDDTRIYNRVLSAGEVQSLYAQGAQ